MKIRKLVYPVAVALVFALPIVKAQQGTSDSGIAQPPAGLTEEKLKKLPAAEQAKLKQQYTAIIDTLQKNNATLSEKKVPNANTVAASTHTAGTNSNKRVSLASLFHVRDKFVKACNGDIAANKIGIFWCTLFGDINKIKWLQQQNLDFQKAIQDEIYIVASLKKGTYYDFYLPQDDVTVVHVQGVLVD